MWLFDAAEPSWRVTVSAAPRFETYTDYFQRAIPQIAAASSGRPPIPAVVVARVTARSIGARAPAGPRDRAKALMDALHDGRSRGPYYSDLKLEPPLPDDDARFVRGLAVEVRRGTADRVEYLLGTELRVDARTIAAVDVPVAAPNDIAGSSAEKLVIDERRAAYVAELAVAWSRLRVQLDTSVVRGLLVRHQPGRDEDNTWATWVGALLGRAEWSASAWPAGAPLSGWRGMAVASVSDSGLPCEVRYEFLAD